MLETLELKELVTHFIISPNVSCYCNCLIVKTAFWNVLPNDIRKFLDEETRFRVAERACMVDGIEGRFRYCEGS